MGYKKDPYRKPNKEQVMSERRALAANWVSSGEHGTKLLRRGRVLYL